MKKEQILEKLKEIFEGVMGVKANENEPISDQNGGSLDSLDCVELLICIEDDFDISIPDDEAEKWVKVSDVVDYLHERTK